MRSLTRDTLEALIASDSVGEPDRRRQAFETFEDLPMPSAKDESWRYAETDVELEQLAVPQAPGDPVPPGDFASAVSDAAGRISIIDGFLLDADVSGPAVVERSAGDGVPAELDKFAAARRAFGRSGCRISIPSGATLDAPIVVDVQSATDGSIGFPSIEVHGGADSESSVVVLHRSPPDLKAVSVPEIVVAADEAARVRLTSIQVHGASTTSITHHRVRVGRDATYRGGEVGLGGQFARVDYGVDLVGRGSSAEVVGVYFGEHDQTLDYRLVMNHIGESTSSDVFMKGAVEDASRSVFTGLLRIEPDARRTSAFETNRNLVLSPGATAHSVPNLEILCDDVVCGHGSSVGPLEDEHLYYLMSRGLSRARAERLLVRGFFAEAIDRLPAPRLADPISRAVNRRFVEAQEAGRLA